MRCLWKLLLVQGIGLMLLIGIRDENHFPDLGVSVNCIEYAYELHCMLASSFCVAEVLFQFVVVRLLLL